MGTIILMENYCGIFTFFLAGCCMAQRRSLSGRSPFCQLFKGLQKTSVWDELNIRITLQVKDWNRIKRWNAGQTTSRKGDSLAEGVGERKNIDTAWSRDIDTPKREARSRMSDVSNIQSIGQNLDWNRKETTAQQLRWDLQADVTVELLKAVKSYELLGGEKVEVWDMNSSKIGWNN